MNCAEHEEIIRELRRQIRIKDEAAHRKNIVLDALHYVWCDGGCEMGVHRYGEHPPLTEEIVAEAERNAKRLRRWLSIRQSREKHSNKTKDDT